MPSGERAGGTLLYLTDRDDEFDSTYATYYFRFPDWVKLPDTEAVETPAEDGWKPFFKATGHKHRPMAVLGNGTEPLTARDTETGSASSAIGNHHAGRAGSATENGPRPIRANGTQEEMGYRIPRDGLSFPAPVVPGTNLFISSPPEPGAVKADSILQTEPAVQLTVLGIEVSPAVPHHIRAHREPLVMNVQNSHDPVTVKTPHPELKTTAVPAGKTLKMALRLNVALLPFFRGINAEEPDLKGEAVETELLLPVGVDARHHEAVPVNHPAALDEHHVAPRQLLPGISHTANAPQENWPLPPAGQPVRRRHPAVRGLRRLVSQGRQVGLGYPLPSYITSRVGSGTSSSIIRTEKVCRNMWGCSPGMPAHFPSHFNIR